MLNLEKIKKRVDSKRLKNLAFCNLIGIPLSYTCFINSPISATIALVLTDALFLLNIIHINKKNELPEITLIEEVPTIDLRNKKPDWFTTRSYLKDLNFNGKVLIDSGCLWFENGVQHRIDGPAVESSNGRNQFYLNGEPLTIEKLNNHPLVIAHKEKKLLEQSINEPKQQRRVKL